MALKNLAAQVKQTPKQPAAVNAEGILSKAHPSVEVTKNALDSAVETANQLKQQQAMVQLSQATATPKAIAENSPNLQSQIEAEMQNPAKHEIPLTWTQQQMLCALSAMQIRYGRPSEAIPYLMMVRKINPKNVEAARLLALSFMRLERWQEADSMVEEYDFLQKSNGTGVVDGLVLLYRSLVSFKSNRIADAKSWFGKFRQFNKVS